MWKWDCTESKGNTPTLLLFQGELVSYKKGAQRRVWDCQSKRWHGGVYGWYVERATMVTSALWVCTSLCTTTHHMRHQLQCGCAHPHSAKWCSMGRCVQCKHIHHDALPLAPGVNRAVCKLHTMQRWKVELVHLTQVVVLQPYTTHGGCRRAVNYYTVC